MNLPSYQQGQRCKRAIKMFPSPKTKEVRGIRKIGSILHLVQSVQTAFFHLEEGGLL